MADWRVVEEASTPTRVMVVDLDKFRAQMTPTEGRPMTIERMKQLQQMAAKIQRTAPAGSDAGALAGVVAELLDALSTARVRVTRVSVPSAPPASLFDLIFGRN